MLKLVFVALALFSSAPSMASSLPFAVSGSQTYLLETNIGADVGECTASLSQFIPGISFGNVSSFGMQRFLVTVISNHTLTTAEIQGAMSLPCVRYLEPLKGRVQAN